MLVIDSSILQVANFYVLCKFNNVERITGTMLADKVSEAVRALELNQRTKSQNQPTVLVFDRGRSWRKLLSSSYKMSRQGNEHYAAIRPEAEALLEKVFLTYAIDGLEADDLAYLLTSHYSNVTLVSNDGDFEAMVRGHGHAWLKYADKSVYRLNNNYSIAVDQAVKANVRKMFIGCASDQVAPVYRESQFEEYARCIKDMDMHYKEAYLKTGVVDELLTFMCMYNGLPLAAQGYLMDNYFLTGYSEVIYQAFCPKQLAEAKAWLSDNKDNLSGLKKISYF